MAFRIRSSLCNHMSDEPCATCDEDRRRGVIFAPAVQSFPSDFICEHAFHEGERPHPVSSRRELNELVTSRGLTSEYLRDSSVWKSGADRWI